MPRDDGRSELLTTSLRKAGLRVTRPRLLVLQALMRQDAPVTHGDVASALRTSGLDRATVFRNLRDLCKATLVLRSDLGDRTWRYELSTQRHKRTHPTFACTRCGALSPLPGIRLVHEDGKKLPRALRKRPVVIHVHGTCDACADAVEVGRDPEADEDAD